ncbi:hypothetical protein [Streptomyces sp. MMBL 11-1]|uniref:hypothetical protein n=1 Tax=Streptomyces sp. MMBL 11-1 TaxID=3026420 RepID=UPI002361062B|nr:hypothetical protein [Streptomyces sp. MMBL 11-1]
MEAELWRRSDARQRKAAAVAVDSRTAVLASLLTQGLGTRVMVSETPWGTGLYLLDHEGRPLRNWGDAPDHTKPATHAVRVAIVPGDPDEPVDVYLDPVADTEVEYAGNEAHPVEDAAGRLIRHYRPAFPRAEAAGR